MVSGSRPHLPHVLISRLVLMYYLAWDVLLQGIIWLKAHCFQLLYLLLYAILQAMSIRCVTGPIWRAISMDVQPLNATIRRCHITNSHH